MSHTDLLLSAGEQPAAPIPRDSGSRLIGAPQGTAPAAHPGGDWWQVKQEEARAERERQEREVAEQEAKARENWHGPRWWEGDCA
jgi:hypothetical protein